MQNVPWKGSLVAVLDPDPLGGFMAVFCPSGLLLESGGEGSVYWSWIQACLGGVGVSGRLEQRSVQNLKQGSAVE